jgi:hypothetical protein
MPLAQPKPTPRRRPVSYFPLPVRMFLMASVAVAGSVYALVRHYTRPHVPMYVAALPDAGAGNELDGVGRLLPAPEIEVLPEPATSAR